MSPGGTRARRTGAPKRTIWPAAGVQEPAEDPAIPAPGGEPTSEPTGAPTADLSARKLGLHGVGPEAKATLTAAGDTGVHRTGEQATLNTVPGHRDGYATLCPGATLYSALPEIRRAAGASVYAH
ncbi:hypothetical protein SUDANB176_04744 [Streptomyces sp. enrichment culture]|uniref:hypothetical protein n=1 Tax=Streptomyces sp. enrichment culture TaxID=1795815 RepID=UPI003F546FC7